MNYGVKESWGRWHRIRKTGYWMYIENLYVWLQKIGGIIVFISNWCVFESDLEYIEIFIRKVPVYLLVCWSKLKCFLI